MSELVKPDTIPNPVCDPNNNLDGHHTLVPGEEITVTAEYSSNCPYDNFTEASVRYSMAPDENMRMKAASRAFYYLSSISREGQGRGQRPELFDLFLFNTAYTALCNGPEYSQLARQCVARIDDEELRKKATDLLSPGEEIRTQKEGIAFTAGSIATQGAVAS